MIKKKINKKRKLYEEQISSQNLGEYQDEPEP